MKNRVLLTDITYTVLIPRLTSIQGTPGSSKVFKVLEFKFCKIRALKVLENEGGPRKSLKSAGKYLVWSGKCYCIIGWLLIEFFTLTSLLSSLSTGSNDRSSLHHSSEDIGVLFKTCFSQSYRCQIQLWSQQLQLFDNIRPFLHLTSRTSEWAVWRKMGPWLSCLIKVWIASLSINRWMTSSVLECLTEYV